MPGPAVGNSMTGGFIGSDDNNSISTVARSPKYNWEVMGLQNALDETGSAWP